ncbi:MAG TPA: efflux RND transporter periplasmic adaptor subunit [Bacteroidales bacterium]|nr:efflux RND transporter periplasmic adaptor subunit [Bacteroidales bacterium]
MKRILIFFVIAIVAIACGNKQQGVSVTENSNTIRVKTGKVQSGSLVETYRYSGTIEPEQTIPLSFQSTGIIDRVFVEEGEFVKKDQLLATVNKSDNQNLYDVSNATYEQAKDAYERLKLVHDNGSLPEVKWVEMETNLKKAESQLQIAKNNLEKCNLYSPVAAHVGRKNVEAGQSALTAVAPIELVKIGTVMVKISVPENEIRTIQKGQKAVVSVSALNVQTEGVVRNVGVVADRFSRTYEVKIAVENPNYLLKPGMVCDVLLQTATEKSIIVPYNAVISDGGKKFVFVVMDDNKHASKQEVNTGNYRAEGLVITGGLNEGQLIVTDGKEKITDKCEIVF